MLERLFKKRANIFVIDPRREFGFAIDFVKGAIEDEEKQENKLKILFFVD